MFIPRLAYEASAGSGKTFALSIRYISLLFLDANPQNILALTFTNKAANEMQERIFTILKELHLPKREAELKELSKILEKDSSYILKKRPKVVDLFLNSDIKISTIDKFLSQILRKFSFYLDLMPDFEIDENKDEELKAEIFLKNLIEKGEYGKFVDFVLLLERRFSDVFYLLERFYERDHEIENIYLKEKKGVSKDTVLANFNEMKEIFFECKSLSNLAKKSLNIENFEDIAASSWICKESLKDYRFFKKCYKEEADRYFFALKEALKSFFDYKEYKILKELLNIYKIYKFSNKTASMELNRLTFTDVTNFVYELLHRHIERDFLYFRLDSKIDHILLDEFQDTSVVQYKILEPLIEEICAGEGVKSFKSFFYVGDTKQSIYRFRGGSKELFYYLIKRFDIDLQALNVNYRSKKIIVDFINDLFKDLMPRYISQTSKENGGYVEVKESEDVIESVIESIAFLKDKGVEDNDIAVLTYTNSDSFEIENALRREFENIKITTETTSLLINQPSVRGVIEFLIYLYFKKDYNKANFLSLIGEDFEKEIDLFENKFDLQAPLPSLIKDIIKKFGLYDKDPNLMKLIEVAFNYPDIESFIFNYESITQNSLSKNEEGIKILTIHKSKGLEFEHLVVCDRLSRKRGGGDSFIFSYEGVELKNIFYRMKGRDCVDKDYFKKVQKEKKLSFEDELNAQYVAFTRAKNSLFICKKDKNSSFDIFGLKPFKKGEIQNFESEKRETKKEEIIFKPFCLNGKVNENDGDNGEKEVIEDLDATVFGISMHYCLEMMETFDKDGFKIAFCSMKNRYGYLLEEDEILDIEKRIKNAISNREFLNLLNGKIRKEQLVSYNGQFYRIDLLIEKENEWIVVDYKSSKEQRVEHREQVEIYKTILRNIFKKSVKGYLFYLKSDDALLIEI